MYKCILRYSKKTYLSTFSLTSPIDRCKVIALSLPYVILGISSSLLFLIALNIVIDLRSNYNCPLKGISYKFSFTFC